jgi:GAF domain-containing protein/ActR/RegA family two-component response regulator
VGELAATFAETLTAVDRRRGELAALLEAGRAIASSLDLEQSLQAIVQQATIISGTKVVRLLLLDADGKHLRSRVGVGLPMEEERDLVIPVGESFSGQVVATGKPLAVADTRGDPRLRYPQHPTRHGLVSYLGLPVKLRDRVVGVLVFNTRIPRTYSEAEIAYLSAFADQAAIAIENARLYEAAQRELAERGRTEAVLRTRTQQLEAVRAIGEEITRELDLRAVLDLITHRAVDLVGASSAMLRLWDQEAGLLVPQSWVGLDMQRAVLNLRLGEGVAGTAAERRQGLLVNDFRHSPYATPLLLERTTHPAVLAEPLLYRDRLIGVINLNREEPGRPFGEEDRELLTLFASQAAIAIENAQLHEAAVRRGEELQAMLRAARTVMSGLDLRGTLDRIIREAAQISRIPHVKVVLVDKEEGAVRVVAAVGRPAEMLDGFAVPLGKGTSGLVAATGEPLFIADCQNDPRNYIYADQDRKLGIHTYLGLPIKIRDEVLGVLTFNTTEPYQYSPAELTYLASFADQAAIAIENARLHEATVRRGEQLEALLSSLKTVTSGLNLREILDRILGEAIRISGALHVKILLLEEATQGLRVALARGGTVQPDFPAPFERSLSGTVAATGQPLFVADSQDESRNPNAAFDRQMGFRTYLGLPVKGRHGVLGVVTFNTTDSRNYSDEELSYLTSFADQAAIAIENARLHEAVRRHAEELESKVRERTAELEEALRVKVEFLGKMSHELRTPLNFVLGFSDLLQQGTAGPLTPKQATYLDRIQGGGRRLLSLVSDVLDIAQLDAGKSRLRLEPVILAPLVQEVLGLVQIQLSQKRLKVTTALDPWMPLIVADRFKLAQILHNLVSNAVKFTPEGGSIRIRTYQEAEGRKQKADGGGEEADEAALLPSAECRLPSGVIEVEDTGIGIRPENLETVFEAFYQVDGSETRSQGGAGLGLALVRKLVELHGGWVWAESAGPGQGSRFVVRLPRLEVPKAKRILLVEDEALIRIPMASALESAGFAVVDAATGAEALAVMEAKAFDLLILDVVLPDMEGWEILRRVREVEEVRTLPALVVTALESLNAEQALALGADEFLTKPVSPRVLVDTVVRLLTSSAASSAGVGPRSVRTGESPGE